MNNLKEINSKNRTCCYFNEITKFEDFDLNNILIDEILQKNISVHDISYKLLIGAKPLRIRSLDGLEFKMELDIQYYLVLKNNISFTTGLDIL